MFFILRLYHITNPPLEVAHNWRQVTVIMPVRNFIEEGLDLFHPKVDFAGEKSGITAMEFPFLNYLIYLTSKIFGYDHWYGRLINLIISSFGLLFFYKLVKKYFEKKMAFHATFVLLFSVWFAYSRKIMPDTFATSLVITGLYYGTNFLDRQAGVKNLLLYTCLISLGVLSKLPMACLLAILPLFLMNRNITLIKKSVLVVVTILALLPVIAWYFYWVPHLTHTYEFEHFFMGKSLLEGAYDIIGHYDKALEKFYAHGVGYIGFALFLYGTYLLIQNRERFLGRIILACTLMFLLVVFKGGVGFYNHSYYMMPYAPVMALAVAYVTSGLKNEKIALVLLSVIAIECILRNNGDFYIKDKNTALISLESDLDKICSRRSLILINSGSVPTPMYFAHRKGWIAYNEQIDEARLNELKTKGLKYVVILKRVFGTEIILKRHKILSNENYCVYEI